VRLSPKKTPAGLHGRGITQKITKKKIAFSEGEEEFMG